MWPRVPDRRAGPERLIFWDTKQTLASRGGVSLARRGLEAFSTPYTYTTKADLGGVLLYCLVHTIISILRTSIILFVSVAVNAQLSLQALVTQGLSEQTAAIIDIIGAPPPEAYFAVKFHRSQRFNIFPQLVDLR